MTVNAGACRLKVLIGDDQQDWSARRKSFDVGFPMRDRGGLLPITGTLTLTYWQYAPEDMNPRVNPQRWQRGQVIRVQVLNESGVFEPHPCGLLYILKEPLPPHPDAPALTLQVGCKLALKDYAEPANDKSGIVLGTATSRTDAIANILAAAGITTLTGTIPAYPIAHPLPRLGGSYVQQAGKVAYAGFKALWQDNAGTIQTADLRLNPASAPTVDITIGVGGGEIIYQPSEGAETPVEELRCVGVDRIGIDTWRCLDSLPAEQYSTEVSGGAASTRILRRTTTVDCQGLNEAGQFYKSREEVVEETANVVYPAEEPGSLRLTFSSRTTTTYLYEPGLTGRLLSIERRIVRPLAAAVAAWWANLSDVQKSHYFRTQPTPSLEERTTFNYQDYPTPQDGSVADQYAFNYQSQVVAGQTVASRAPIAAIATNEDLTNVDPLALVPSGLTQESWAKVRGYEWQKRTITQAPFIQANPDAAASSTSISSKIALVTTDDQTDISAAGGQQPSAPERRPDRYTEIEIQVKGRALFGTLAGANEQKRNRTIEVEYLVAGDQAAAIARTEGALLIGRRQGQTILVPWSALFLAHPEPLPLWRCTEKDGATYVYQADAIHYTHDEDRAIVGCNGVWLATIPAGTTAPRLPYRAIVPFGGGLCFGGTLRVYPYSLAPVTIGLAGGLKVGGSLTQLIAASFKSGLRLGGAFAGKPVQLMPGGLRLGGNLAFGGSSRLLGGGVRLGGDIRLSSIRKPLFGGLRIGGSLVNATADAYTQQWRTNAISGGGTVSSGTFAATAAFISNLGSTRAKLNLLWHFSGDFAASKYCLLYPSGHPGFVTYAGFSSGQYSETTGLTSTGNAYADLNYVPATYQASDTAGSLVAYCHTAAPNGATLGVADPSNREFALYARNSDGNAYYDCYNNTNGRVAIANGSGQGLFIGSRTAGNNAEITKNGAVLATSTAVMSGSRPNLSLIAFGLYYQFGQTVTRFTADQRLSLIAVGEGLDSTDVATINSAYTTYAAAIGRSLP